MIIKRYLVNNMNEGLTRIRNELGKSAVIISQRKVRKPGIKGFFEPKVIEVTAAAENTQKGVAASQKDEPSMEDSIHSLKKIMEDSITKKSKNNIKEENNPVSNVSESNSRDIDKELCEMKTLLNKVVENTNKETLVQKDPLIDIMEELDIDSNFYDEFKNDIGDIKDEEEVRKILKDIVVNNIEISNEELRGNVVLVGPTGVGKTTTIAKLAGKLALKENKKVGLITIDTYRIGAVDQLRTYAEIMNIPFKVVITAKEMEEAIKSMDNCDVILIDSTGRSSKNTMQISELRTFIDKTSASSINLVVSSTTKNKDVKAIIEGYKILNYDKVIITKLDETIAYGTLYNIQKFSKKPIRFVTTGQNVPDDIKEYNKEELVNIIFGEANIW